MVNMRFTMAKIVALGLGAILALGVTLLALLYTGLKSVEAPLDNLTRLSKSNTATTPEPMKDEDGRQAEANRVARDLNAEVAALREANRREMERVLWQIALFIVSASGITVFVIGVVTRPVKMLKDAAEAIRCGEFGHRIEPHGQGELRYLAEDINRIVSQLETASATSGDLQRMTARLRQESAELEAVGYARQVGYQRVQAASNGIEFAKSPEFCKQAAAAGLTSAYLQFDGIGNAANSHRHVGNLFDVKLRAMENLSAAGVDIVPVTTIINGINNEQVGRIIEFALDNTDRITFLSFQPVSFTGRDEEISDIRRMAQRYTMSHLAHDVKRQTGLGEPVRDWFPISFTSIFSDWCDQVSGPQADWGQVSCGCHPNCGAGMGLLVDKETKEAVPVP